MNKLIDELITLISNNNDFQEMVKYQKRIDNHTKELIKEYHINKSIELKKEILKDHNYKEYLKYADNFNYLVMQINQKFKRSHVCANH